MHTERLNIAQMPIKETGALITKTKATAPELSEAYAEMLAGGKTPYKVYIKQRLR